MKARRPSSGFSLIGAMMAIVVGSIAMLAIQSVLTLSFRGSHHADIRLAIRSLSETISDRVDCGKTMAQITDPATECSASNPKPILLKDSTNNALTGPMNPVTGVFNPTDETLVGSGKLGNWQIRAYCQAPGNTLYVRYARTTDGTSFLKDAFTKRAYNWETSDTNPLFGTADRVLCDKSTGTSGNTKAIFCPNSSTDPTCLAAEQNFGTGDGSARVVNCRRNTKFAPYNTYFHEGAVALMLRYQAGVWKYYNTANVIEDCVDGTTLVIGGIK